MMKLQTKIPLHPAQNQFGYENKLLLLGSCFSENIGAKLDYFKFQSVTNPFGIIFNPLALERVIKDAVSNKTYTEADVFELDRIWKSFYAHSHLNSDSRLGSVINLQEAQQSLREQLQVASHVFITLGTAWVYEHIASGIQVANCHKVPQKEFCKTLLSVDAIEASFVRIIDQIRDINSTAAIIFTVSPVRHLKDGFVENTRSKAHLISAVHKVVDTGSCYYFPAYELMMDELRDYRFYKTDMLHPSDQAVDYIWEQFVGVYAFAKAQTTMKKVHTVQQGLHHKPFNVESEAYQKFKQKLNEDIKELVALYPFMNF